MVSHGRIAFDWFHGFRLSGAPGEKTLVLASFVQQTHVVVDAIVAIHFVSVAKLERTTRDVT